MVAVALVVPVFVAKKEGKLPEPLAGRPIAGLLLVHVKVVPATVPEKLTAVEKVLLHRVWLLGAATVGVGLIVRVKILDVPVQLAVDGVTVKVAITETICVLVGVKDAISPDPLAGIPIEGISLVQL